MNWAIDERNYIVCFGAGKVFDKFFELFPQYAKKIKYIVDNNSLKWGNKKEIQGYYYDIVSPNYFKDNYCASSDLLLLTIGRETRETIIQQYNCIDPHLFLDSNDYMEEYCTYMFDKANVPFNIRRAEKQIIPKRINYIWFGKSEFPDENRKWMESWKKYCPEYEIVRWDENNYDVKKNKYMYDAYCAGRFGFASDYARLDIIYNHGGVYLDTDVELVRPIDELLYQKAYMGWEDGLRVNTGLGFGSIKGFSLLEEMMNYYEFVSFFNEFGMHNLTACPTYQTNVLCKHGLVKNGEYQIVSDLAILPVTYLCGKPCYVKHSTKTNYTISIHHTQGSWKR